jgi:hypothetical protein
MARIKSVVARIAQSSFGESAHAANVAGSITVISAAEAD